MRTRALLLIVCLLGAVGVQAQRTTGTVCVHNCTSKTIYVVVNGRNQGDLGNGTSQDYSVPFGDVKVEAYKGYTSNDPYAKKWASVSASYPSASVDFSDSDF